MKKALTKTLAILLATLLLLGVGAVGAGAEEVGEAEIIAASSEGIPTRMMARNLYKLYFQWGWLEAWREGGDERAMVVIILLMTPFMPFALLIN